MTGRVAAFLALAFVAETAACRERPRRPVEARAPSSPESTMGADSQPGAGTTPPEDSDAWFSSRCQAACSHVGALIRADVGALEGASPAFLAELDALAGAPCVERCVEARDLAATTCVLVATDLLSLGSCQPRAAP